MFIFERILREVRSRHVTYVSKVIQHPSKVMEIQIKKEKTKTRAGQYIFLSCPEVSYWQWHPFTLTSAPEEDYISVHIRIVGDFTSALAKALGCDFDAKDEKSGKQVTGAANPPINKVLPRVMVDGPFGSASEDFLNVRVILRCLSTLELLTRTHLVRDCSSRWCWYRCHTLRLDPQVNLVQDE